MLSFLRDLDSIPVMQAAYINKYGAEEKLSLGEFPMPVPGDNDILVRIKAASVNPIDFKIKEGMLKFLRKNKFPLILGHDLAGEVVEVGSKVIRFKKGDSVFARVANERIGTFAEYIAFDQANAALMPQGLSFEEAASLPLVGLTTWQAFEAANLRPGQKVLIQAGAGGVGTFAIQLAKVRGAEVWTTTSEKNEDFVKSLGADHIINYRKQDPWSVLKDMDLIFDTLGGDSLYKSFGALKPGGLVVSVSGDPDESIAQAMDLGFVKRFILGMVGRKAHRLAAAHKARYMFLFMKPSGQQLEQIKALVEQRKIHPVIDKVFPLASAQQALDYSKAGSARGKIIIKVAE